MVMLKKADRNELQAKYIPLLVDMFNTYYGPFKTLPIAQKKLLILDIYNEKLQSAYLSSKHGIGPDDTRLMDSLCTYVDFHPSHAQWFFDVHVKDAEHLKYYHLIVKERVQSTSILDAEDAEAST
jgi:hypothetical protein